VDWQFLGYISGATLLGAALLRAMGAAYGGRRRMRALRERRAQQRQDFEYKLQTVLQRVRASKPIFKAWSDTRQFQVAAIVEEGVDYKSFYLLPVDGHPLPRFEPGQFLTFKLPANPHQKPLVRCYSLSDRPNEAYYRVTVKYARPPVGNRSALAGLGSGFFHERVRVGTILDVKAPQGAFFLDPTDDSPVVLIGCGIGVTPVLSMAQTIAHERLRKHTYFFGGFGNSTEHPFLEDMQTLAAEHENLSLDLSYSRPLPSDQLGRDYDQRGYVDFARVKQVLPSNNFRFYLCGPAAMLEAMVPALEAWGVPESQIHFEAFGPSTVRQTRKKRAAADLLAAPCQVEFLLAQAKLAWDGSHESLLDFAESQGVALDYGCRAGNCGQCLVPVKVGSVEHVKEPGMRVQPGECLTCIGVPQGDVVLDA
jgi:ferredoxin-NADP reductase